MEVSHAKRKLSVEQLLPPTQGHFRRSAPGLGPGALCCARGLGAGVSMGGIR